MSSYHPIEPAILDWCDNSPKSTTFDDIYFSSGEGLDETRYVFLQANQLPQRWQQNKEFSIAETGFGTGLNFLTTAACWLENHQKNAKLHYFAVEKHPLTQEDLNTALQQWPTLNAVSTELLANYPPLVHGFHQRQLFDKRITLTLMFGDASAMFADLQAETKIDAWYLDGFSPKKNPAMWSEALFQQIARLTRPGGSLSTFTAAGAVRRGLIAAGFEMKKQAGFGRKRDMLVGSKTQTNTTRSSSPWFAFTPQRPKQKSAIIIGAGLAGCATAQALAQRDWKITLIERHSGIAQGASGNHAGVVLPRLTADMDCAGRFYLSAFMHTSHWLAQQKGIDWHRSGVMQLAHAPQIEKIRALHLPSEIVDTLNAQAASQLSGTTLNSGALYYPGAGWLSPPQLCQYLLDISGSNIQVKTTAEAIEFKYVGDMWHVLGATDQLASAPVLILANGYDAARFSPQAWPLQKVRGQLAYLSPSAQSKTLNTPVCYNGYALPAYKNKHCIGASYDGENESEQFNKTDQNDILTALQSNLGQFKPGDVCGHRVAFRTASPDHLPLIGPVVDAAQYRSQFNGLKYGKTARYFDNAQYPAGLFINTGHGSRGLVSCPLAAHYLASLLNDEPLPLPTDLINAVHPARFLVRQLRKGNID